MHQTKTYNFLSSTEGNPDENYSNDDNYTIIYTHIICVTLIFYDLYYEVGNVIIYLRYVYLFLLHVYA